MKKLICMMAAFIVMPAWGMNETANMLRRCEGVNVTNSDNYILKCRRDDKILHTMSNAISQFFPADNYGDIRGSFLDSIPDNDEFIYVNVVRNSSDTRYRDQICYRFITEKDISRDGFYATQVCEYERADYYL